MKGIIAEKAVHIEHIRQRRMAIHDQNDCNQIQRTKDQILFPHARRFFLHRDAPSVFSIYIKAFRQMDLMAHSCLPYWYVLS